MKSNYKNIALIVFTALALSATAKDGLGFNSNIKSNNQQKSFLNDKQEGNKGIKHKFIITAGAGFNFPRYNYSIRYFASDFYKTMYTNDIPITVSYSPVINGQVGYRIGRYVAICMAVGFQRNVVDYSAGTYSYYNNSIVYPYTSAIEVKDTWTRMCFSISGDYRILASKNIGIYSGLRVGINSYTMTSTYETLDPNYVSDLNVHFSPVSIQTHIGIDYWFAKIIGINMEAGIGYNEPYLIALGITAKL